MKSWKKDVIGNKYGMATVVSEMDKNKHGQRVVTFICDCGKTSQTELGNLVSGQTKSCGCFRRTTTSERMATHGLSKSSNYNVLNNMKQRCYNKNSKAYIWYGARGITICQEWLDDARAFDEFCITHSRAPGLQIDRIDNDKGYSPNNCRFVTPAENQKNKRTVYSSNSSGYRGVSLIGPSYKVSIYVEGTNVQKRGFKTALEAAVYRDAYVIDNNLELPLNFPLQPKKLI